MQLTPVDPPRVFDVGCLVKIQLKDCGRVALEADEQVTFVTETGGEFDVVRKSWGFYATPSLNQRLPRFGLRAVLVKSPDGKYYVWLVERGKEPDFQRYLEAERQAVVSWLDTDQALERLAKQMERAPA
ncbi:MAG: hypothetical protein HY599_06620 [Candidatus Omnitrophica bacterium]|nr:hypothetical protein [Candidatus Omnitrophota bacterium]